MIKRAVTVLGFVAIAVAAWIATASWFYCLVAAHSNATLALSMFRFPYAQWIDKAPDISANWFMTTVMVGTGIVGLLPAAIVLLICRNVIGSLPGKIQSLYGDSKFANQAEMRQGGITLDRKPM